jgi:hypothetical protein
MDRRGLKNQVPRGEGTGMVKGSAYCVTAPRPTPKIKKAGK